MMAVHPRSEASVDSAAALDMIAFDADDTLWHDISTYMRAKDAFLALLCKYRSREAIDRELDATELRNLDCFGYGAKGFILSMIETALEITERRISSAEIGEIIELGKAILQSPITPLPDVERTLFDLSGRFQLLAITKGDLFDQEAKMARSGLGDYFDELHVVSEKTVATYAKVLARHAVEPHRFLMIGNSLKSDVLPVLELGGWAIHVPYEITWFMEHADLPEERPRRQFSANSIAMVPDIVAAITTKQGQV